MLKLRNLICLVALFLIVSPLTETCSAQDYYYYPPTYQDYVNNLVYTMELAKAGNPVAQYTIGICYLRGVALPQNINLGVELIARSAKQNYAPALCVMGMLFIRGQHVPQNVGLAVKMYQLSAAQGFAPAQVFLGDCFLNGVVFVQDTAQAVVLYRLAAAQGNLLAVQRLRALGF